MVDYNEINRELILSLDYKTVGIYCKIIELDSYDSFGEILQKLRDNGQNISEKTLRSAMIELEDAGFLRREAIRDEKGGFISWDYEFYMKPVPEEERTFVGRRK